MASTPAGTLTIGDVARAADVPPTTLRYYEQVGLLAEPGRIGGQRRYDESVLARLEVVRLCKLAGFSLEEMVLLFTDDAPGRVASRSLAEAKLAEIDSRIASLVQARQVIEWGMACECPSINDCQCGIHRDKPAWSQILP